MAELQQSDYRIRKLIGILGLALPFALPLTANDFLSSISHYYYLPLPSLILIIILSTLALFLISYKGYKIDGTGAKEYLSDDWITNIGGLAALIVVIVPTCCYGSESVEVEAICELENYPLLGHDLSWKDSIHLISAVVFLFAMGWMSIYKFTRGSEKDSLEYMIYNICGYLVWGSIGVLFVYFALKRLINDFPEAKYIIYIMETIAVVPFGVSWLIKGKTMPYLRNLMGRSSEANSTRS